MPVCTRSLACRMKKHTSKYTTGTPQQAGTPCAMVLRFPSCSPRRPGFFATVIGAMQSIVANLTPALACQDHTTSPSALISLVWRHQRVHRIPHPNVRDDAYAPLSGNGTGRACRDDLPDGHSEIFLRKGLDHPNQIELP